MKWLHKLRWLLGGTLGILIFTGIASLWTVVPPLQGKKVEAKVIRFGSNPSRWSTNWITVIAATPDGLEGQGSLSRDMMDALDCRVGDPVAARLVGVTLQIDPNTCGKASAHI